MAVSSTILATVAVASAGASAYQGRKAAKESERAQQYQQRISEVRARRQTRQQIREARIKRAQIQNLAAQTGAEGSSGVAGAVASLQTGAASNVSFIGAQMSLGKLASEANIRASGYQSKAATYGAVSSVASQFAGPGGFQQLGATIFGE